MPRKIIQIAATPDVYVIALCDDGSTWICLSNGVTRETWQPLPDIPQHSCASGRFGRKFDKNQDGEPKPPS